MSTFRTNRNFSAVVSSQVVQYQSSLGSLVGVSASRRRRLPSWFARAAAVSPVVVVVFFLSPLSLPV